MKPKEMRTAQNYRNKCQAEMFNVDDFKFQIINQESTWNSPTFLENVGII